MSVRPCALCWLTLLALAGVPQRAGATDYFLTIGGGYAPTGNQVSLEKNVQFLQQLLREKNLEPVQHDIYFSDGDDPVRDLQYHDPSFKLPRVDELLARIAGNTDYLDCQYRNHDIAGVRGAASRENIRYWFDKIGAGLHADDRLLVYVTAHGGRSNDRKAPHNTLLHLWNQEHMTMTELVTELDKVPAEVPVVVVMVQCYSGGFADMIFRGGQSDQGPTASRRCGFFATVHDRPAAGCTPDIQAEDYHEYSSYFWAALAGHTRTGQPVETADYDGDGHVSFAEAHAFALVTSETIDVSVCTSDAFLRQFSRLGPADDGKKGEEGAPPPVPLLTADAPYEDIAKLASPISRVVLEGLSSRLGLKDAQRAEAARKLAAATEREEHRLDGEIRNRNGEVKAIARQLQEAVNGHWPELANRWHPAVTKILEQDGDAIVRTIEAQPKFGRFDTLSREIADLSRQRLDLDRRWAACQRLVRALENVALGANLPHVATPEIQQRYQQLMADEMGCLQP